MQFSQFTSLLCASLISLSLVTPCISAPIVQKDKSQDLNSHTGLVEIATPFSMLSFHDSTLQVDSLGLNLNDDRDEVIATMTHHQTSPKEQLKNATSRFIAYALHYVHIHVRTRKVQIAKDESQLHSIQKRQCVGREGAYMSCHPGATTLSTYGIIAIAFGVFIIVAIPAGFILWSGIANRRRLHRNKQNSGGVYVHNYGQEIIEPAPVYGETENFHCSIPPTAHLVDQKKMYDLPPPSYDDGK